MERAAESDKPVGNGKRMGAKKAMDSYGSGARTQGSGTTYLYPANTREVGHESEVREGVVWRWGEGGAYFGVPVQNLLREIFYWDDIPPKRGKHELESLGACYRDKPSPFPIGSAKESKKQNKTTFVWE